jgi:hypothetical protein
VNISLLDFGKILQLQLNRKLTCPQNSCCAEQERFGATGFEVQGLSNAYRQQAEAWPKQPEENNV